MKLRWKFWGGIAGACIALYAAAGFWLVPWALERTLVNYAHESLHRQAGVDRIAFNPFTLDLQADGLRLDEAGDAPIFGIGRLRVRLQWRSLASWAWRFEEIDAAYPTAYLFIAPDGRFNLAELLDTITRGQPPSKDSALPRIVVERFAIHGARVDMQDRNAGYANTLAPLDFELDGFSTVAERADEHVLTARSKRGGTIRWKGRAGVNPIRAEGEFVAEGVSLPEFSVYLKPKVKASIAAGKLSATLPYKISYANGRLDARLDGAQVAASDLAFVRDGASDAFASLASVSATGIDADLVRRDVAIREFKASKGRVALRRNAAGELDLAQLVAADGPQTSGPGATRATRATAETRASVDAAAANAGWKLAASRVAVEDVAVAVVDETVNPPLRLEAGHVDAGMALRAGQAATLELALSGATASVRDLSLARGAAAPLKIATIGFQGGALDLSARTASVERAFAEGASLHVTRDRQGAIDLAGWLPKPGGGPSGPPWNAFAKRVELAKFDVDVADEASGIHLRATDARVAVDGLGTAAKEAVKFDAALALSEGGTLAAQGAWQPARGDVQAQVKASRVALKPLQPLLDRYVKLKIAGGAISAQGRVATGTGTRESPVLRYDGDVEVTGFDLRELDADAFASWRRIGASQVRATLSPGRVDVPELRIDGAVAKLIIEQDRSFNAARLLVQQPDAGASASEPSTASGGEPFPVRVRRVRIQDAKLDFTDLSLAPQFAAKIHELNGVVNGLSTSPSAHAQIELDGRVDEFGVARIRGETSLATPQDSTDVNVVFRNVDMVAASPYTMKFAGYRIAEGRISLDLQYRIRDRQLEGDNKILIDRLALGERVDSPDAMKIPLQLAIAVLKDADGRIDLGLPVSGDLRDPKFSYGAIIGKAIANMLTKIVTAPFRALGAMLGIDADKLEAIVFDAGSGKLLPPEREKLKQIVQILGKREGLRLAVAGQYSEAADGAALRARAVRREVARRAGIPLNEGEEAGPLDFGDRHIRSALRELFAARFGDAELDKAKKSAEAAPAAGGASAPALPIWQRVGRMVQGEPQVADSAAFYTQLRERLEREQALPAGTLARLGEERARAIVAALVEGGVDASRVTPAATAAVEAPGRGTVPVKLELAGR